MHGRAPGISHSPASPPLTGGLVVSGNRGGGADLGEPRGAVIWPLMAVALLAVVGFGDVDAFSGRSQGFAVFPAPLPPCLILCVGWQFRQFWESSHRREFCDKIENYSDSPVRLKNDAPRSFPRCRRRQSNDDLHNAHHGVQRRRQSRNANRPSIGLSGQSRSHMALGKGFAPSTQYYIGSLGA